VGRSAAALADADAVLCAEVLASSTECLDPAAGTGRSTGSTQSAPVGRRAPVTELPCSRTAASRLWALCGALSGRHACRRSQIPTAQRAASSSTKGRRLPTSYPYIAYSHPLAGMKRVGSGDSAGRIMACLVGVRGSFRVRRRCRSTISASALPTPADARIRRDSLRRRRDRPGVRVRIGPPRGRWTPGALVARRCARGGGVTRARRWSGSCRRGGEP